MAGFVQTVVITFRWSHSVACSRAEERAGQGSKGEETPCKRQYDNRYEQFGHRYRCMWLFLQSISEVIVNFIHI